MIARIVDASELDDKGLDREDEPSPSAGKEPKGLARNFEVPGLQNIRQGGTRTKVFMARKAISYTEHLETVPAQYHYVYRKGDLVNPMGWDLAPGTLGSEFLTR